MTLNVYRDGVNTNSWTFNDTVVGTTHRCRCAAGDLLVELVVYKEYPASLYVNPGWLAEYEIRCELWHDYYPLRRYVYTQTAGGQPVHRHENVYRPARQGPRYSFLMVSPGEWVNSPTYGDTREATVDVYIFYATHKLLYDTATGKLLRGVNPSQLLLRDD